jgi:hypothetical protein
VDVALLWHIAAVCGACGCPRVAFVTMYPLCYGLQIGQFSLILVTSWAAAYVLLRRGHERWAGVALAPLLIKPELLLPVAAYLAWKRRWRVFSTLLPLTAASVAVSVAVVGVPAALSYRCTCSQHEVARLRRRLERDVRLNGIVAMVWERPSDSIPGLAVLLALTAITLAGSCASRGALDPRSDVRVAVGAVRSPRCSWTRTCTCRTPCSSCRQQRRCSLTTEPKAALAR